MAGQQTAFRFPPRLTHHERCKLEGGSRRESLDERFARFDTENPHVFDAIWREAEEQRGCGARRISVKFIIESLRRDPRLQSDGDKWKINNSFASRYARKLIRVAPVFDGLIELREMG